MKATLHDLERIPPHRQRLVFACSALPDDDDTTLANHGVVHSATIQLVETKMQVFIRWVGLGGSLKTISDVESSDTVEGFRLRVQQDGLGIRPAKQRLIIYGLLQMEDGHTLAEYGVQDGITMKLLARWHVNFRTRGVELDMDVKDKVGRIKQRVQEATGVPVECQSVFLRGEELDDGQTLPKDDIEMGTFVPIRCRRQERGAVTNTTRKRKGEEPVIVKETVKRRANVTGPGKKNKKIPAHRWRRFTVYLQGPELAEIYPSSCDPDPVA
jgi:hypothetical protein